MTLNQKSTQFSTQISNPFSEEKETFCLLSKPSEKPCEWAQCMIESLIPEAIDNVKSEVQPPQIQQAVSILQNFSNQLTNLQTIACVKNIDGDFPDDSVVEFMIDDTKRIWYNECGDDSDSSNYAVNIAENIDELIDMWKFYIKEEDKDEEYDVYNFWEKYYKTFLKEDSGRSIPEIINIPSLYFGTNPVTNKGPKPFESPYLNQGNIV